MSSNIIAAMVGFVALTTMTRFVGDEYGSLMWAMAFAATFNAIADVGFSSANVKRISEGQDVNDCISTFLVVKIALTAVMMLATISFFFVYIFLLGNQIYTASIFTLLLFVLYWALMNMSTVFTSLFKARKETSKMVSVQLIDPLIRTPVVVILALGGSTATELAMAYVLGAAAMVMVGILLMRRGGIRLVRPTLFRSYLKFALPLSGIVFLNSLLVNLDILLLGYFWDNIQVGYYAASFKLVELGLTFGAAISTLIYPSISELHRQGDFGSIREVTGQAQRFVSMVGMPMTVYLAIFAYQVANIAFGGGYIDAGGPLTVAAIMLYIALVTGIQGQVLLGCNRPDLLARSKIMMLVVRVVLLLVFIPASIFGIPMLEMKATGAALAGLLGWVAFAILVQLFTYRVARVSVYRRLWIHILAGVMTAAVMLLISLFIPVEGFFNMLFLAGVTLAVFLAFLYLLREFTKDDLSLILEAVDPRKMARYIKGELGEDRRP